MDLSSVAAALDKAWSEISPGIAAADIEKERARLAFIVTSLSTQARDEGDLVRKAVQQFRR
ncbi:MAG: hypothetical protein DI537_38330 [Stutzerimonas stutzeri]|nr:MAG: hypothetical protein DI537_38330 [Stutzerimonas stutzeri]